MASAPVMAQQPQPPVQLVTLHHGQEGLKSHPHRPLMAAGEG